MKDVDDGRVAHSWLSSNSGACVSSSLPHLRCCFWRVAHICVVLNPALNALEAHRKLQDGSDVLVRRHPKKANDPQVKWTLRTGVKYRLQIDWSPYSNGLIAFLHDENGAA